MFSSVIRLGDLDYIAPSQACIKPILDQQKEDAARKRFLLEGGGGGGTVHIRGKGDDMPPPAPRPIKITLADCLACNGCVTTAEEILIEQQKPSEVMATVARIKELKDGTPTIASISPQSVASLCVQFRDASPLHTFQKLRYFFTKIVGLQHVVSTRWAEGVSRREVCVEFNARRSSGLLPMLISACPGFVCYVEKSHPNMIPHLSTTMSPQAIMGVALSHAFGPTLYHVSIQPCFDRKLEASRAEHCANTHCVLSSIEVFEWVKRLEVVWSDLPTLGPTVKMETVVETAIPRACPHQGSGAYHQSVLLAQNIAGSIVYTPKRNANHCDVSLPGAPKASIMYGFQHIQNLSRTMKKKSSVERNLPEIIEVMACPGGCTNGGAQGRPRGVAEDNAGLLKAVNGVFEDWNGGTEVEEGGELIVVNGLNFHTTFTDRSQTSVASEDIPDVMKLHALKW